MPFIKFTEQEKESANTTNIVDYLTSHGESVKRCGREFVWNSPSGRVTIHGSEWYSQYEQVGGGAVNFVRKFYGLSYPDAVRSLLGSNAGTEIVRDKKEPKEEIKEFELPPKHTDMRRVYGYLLNERHIDRDVLTAFAREGLIYEDAEHHNVVFVGKDTEGVPCHAQKRSTVPNSDFKGNLSASVAEYAFHYNGSSEYLFVFEAPIDMLAFISLNKNGWENHSYVSLCSTADRAAVQMLKDNPNLKTVFLCLDHDNAGIEGCYRLSESIHALGEYSVWRRSPKNKDWDEDLRELNGKDPIPSSECFKLEFIKQEFAELEAYSVDADESCEMFLRYPSDIDKDGINKLWSLHGRHEIDKMPSICLAMCQIRDRKLGKEDNISDYVSRMKNQYKPHRDTESSEVLYEFIKDEIALLESDLKSKDAVTASQIDKQNGKILSLALDCLRFCGASEREELSRMKQSFGQSM